MRLDPYTRVGAVIRNADGALLVVRHERDGDAFWTFPGGLLHVGESLSYALRRGVAKETGLQIRIGNVVCVGEVTLSQVGRRRVEVYFEAHCIDTRADLRDGASWIGSAELRYSFSPNAALDAVMRNATGVYLANITDARRSLPETRRSKQRQ